MFHPFLRLTKDQLNLNATFAAEQLDLWFENRTGDSLSDLED